jgi:hypothetical protein
VYPAASHPFADSHFIQLSSHRKIRVVHINADARKYGGWCMNGAGPHVETMGLPLEGCHYNSKHRNLSLISNNSEVSSEEYWFTRWNRPLRMEDSCNCSFRKSWRNSLRDSRVILSEMQEDPKDSADQMCSLTPCEKYVGQECALPSRSHKLLQIENFVEEVLKEVWNEVFSCLTQIEHNVNKQSQLKLECMPNCINRHRDKGLEHNCVCRNKSEPLGNYEFRNDHFNCQTVISCHETTNNCHVVETVDKNVEGTDVQQLVSTSLKSVGCINPAFLGSSMNPDVESAVLPGDQPVECDSFALGKGLPGIVREGTKVFDDMESDVNTVSLEFSNGCISNTGCFKIANEHSDVGQHACATEKTETDSYTASPNEIRQTEFQARISASSHLSDKIIEAKDDTQEYNQTSFTSVDVRLQDTNRTQENNSTDGGPRSQRSNVQQGRNKQCYHTTKLKRLVSDIFSVYDSVSNVCHSPYFLKWELYIPDSFKIG